MESYKGTIKNNVVGTGIGMQAQVKTAGGNRSKRCYSPRDLDLIAAYVIPVDAWYLIPLRALYGRKTIRVCPHRPSRRPFECFRNAWSFLLSSRALGEGSRSARVAIP